MRQNPDDQRPAVIECTELQRVNRRENPLRRRAHQRGHRIAMEQSMPLRARHTSLQIKSKLMAKLIAAFPGPVRKGNHSRTSLKTIKAAEGTSLRPRTGDLSLDLWNDRAPCSRFRDVPY